MSLLNSQVGFCDLYVCIQKHPHLAMSRRHLHLLLFLDHKHKPIASSCKARYIQMDQPNFQLMGKPKGKKSWSAFPDLRKSNCVFQTCTQRSSRLYVSVTELGHLVTIRTILTLENPEISQANVLSLASAVSVVYSVK